MRYLFGSGLLWATLYFKARG